MRKNQSLFQELLLRIHYKTSLALISIFLGILAFSGFYFFGQNIVNEADEKQRIARIQMNQSDDEKEAAVENTSLTPTISKNSNEAGLNIGGIDEQENRVTPTGTTSATPTTVSVTPTVTPTATPSQVAALDATKFIIGDPNAEKTIIAYYDLECAFCADFVRQTLPVLKKEYLDTGKAKLIFKNFPLSTHPNAPIAHNAALCASVNGDFWEFHDTAFINQSEWSGKDENQIKDFMKSYSELSGQAKAEFNSCVDNTSYISVVENDKKVGKDAGVTGTPTFIIGDKILVGSQPIESFRGILDAE